jgi:hypothetical protein
MIAPRAIAGATRVSRGYQCRCRSISRNHHRHRAWCALPSSLACLPRTRRRRTILGECRRSSLREPLSLLKSNPWRSGGVFIAVQIWCDWTVWYRWARTFSSYWTPMALYIYIYIYIYIYEVMEWSLVSHLLLWILPFSIKYNAHTCMYPFNQCAFTKKSWCAATYIYFGR